LALLDGDWKDALQLPVGDDFSGGSERGYSIAVAAFIKHRDWQLGLHDPFLVLTPPQAAKQLRMVDKNPAQHVPQRIVFESILQGAHHHEFLASEGWWANDDGRGLTTTYSHEVLRGEERTGDTGAWAISIIDTGMPAEKQQQFRADIKANSKPWDSEIEFTMPGELKSSIATTS
jgi:hypothetical protein